MWFHPTLFTPLFEGVKDIFPIQTLFVHRVNWRRGRKEKEGKNGRSEEGKVGKYLSEEAIFGATDDSGRNVFRFRPRTPEEGDKNAAISYGF